jgi:hypothetical protein
MSRNEPWTPIEGLGNYQTALYEILAWKWHQHGDGSDYPLEIFLKDYHTEESAKKAYDKVSRKKSTNSKPKPKRKPIKCSCKKK